MRVICTIPTAATSENAHHFSAFLKKHGIENQCEEVILPDTAPFYRIWGIDEDKIEKGKELYAVYRENPESHNEPPIEKSVPPQAAKKSALSPSPFGPISIIVIVICIATYLWGEINDGISVPPKIKGVIEAPQLKSIDRLWAFDYPAYFELRDNLLKVYPKEAITKGDPIPEKGEIILDQMKRTPFWAGFYDRLVLHLRQPSYPLSYSGPLFEKIKAGEYWRLITPALLHFNFLHIFFNLLWFIMLGNQIEWRLGPFRYIFLMVVIALVSNVSQYLMSGSFFLGLSGVVVGLAGFVWARKQKAPWEGYLLQRATFGFLMIFILGIFALQVVFFIFQLAGKINFTIPIANTAHLVGGVVGYLMGKSRLFALRKKRSV